MVVREIPGLRAVRARGRGQGQGLILIVYRAQAEIERLGLVGATSVGVFTASPSDDLHGL